jgi:hypothetical protein
MICKNPSCDCTRRNGIADAYRSFDIACLGPGFQSRQKPSTRSRKSMNAKKPQSLNAQGKLLPDSLNCCAGSDHNQNYQYEIGVEAPGSQQVSQITAFRADFGVFSAHMAKPNKRVNVSHAVVVQCVSEAFK